MHEEFKTEFRKSDSYRRTNKHFSDSEIFAISRDGVCFIRPKTRAAFEAWSITRKKEEPLRQAFETAFKETKEYKLHVELGHMEKMDIFERHPEEGWYYHPSVALAWKFYNLGAK